MAKGLFDFQFPVGIERAQSDVTMGVGKIQPAAFVVPASEQDRNPGGQVSQWINLEMNELVQFMVGRRRAFRQSVTLRNNRMTLKRSCFPQ